MPRRCCFTVNGRACGRAATGNPPLCQKHLADFAEGETDQELDEEYETGNEILDGILAHPVAKHLFGRLNHAIDHLGNVIEHGIDGVVGQARPAPGGRRPPPPRPTPEAPKEDPRAVLGFGPSTPLTSKLIKERRRKLAEMYHPDKGGNDAGMQRINAAADALLEQLKK